MKSICVALLLTVFVFINHVGANQANLNIEVLNGSFVVEIRNVGTSNEIALYSLNSSGTISDLIFITSEKSIGEIKEAVVVDSPEPGVFILEKNERLSFFSYTKKLVGMRHGVITIARSPKGVMMVEKLNQITHANFENPTNVLSPYTLELMHMASQNIVSGYGQFLKIDHVDADEFVVVSEKSLVRMKLNLHSASYIQDIDLKSVLNSWSGRKVNLDGILGLVANKQGAWIHTTEEFYNPMIWGIYFSAQKIVDNNNLGEQGSLLDMSKNSMEVFFKTEYGELHSIVPGYPVKKYSSQLFTEKKLAESNSIFPKPDPKMKRTLFFKKIKGFNGFGGSSSLIPPKNNGPVSIADFTKLISSLTASLKPRLMLTNEIFSEMLNTSYALRYSFYDLPEAVMKSYGLYLQSGWIRSLPGREDEIFTRTPELAESLSKAVCQKLLQKK